MSYQFETEPANGHEPRPRSSIAAVVLASLAVAFTLYLAQDVLLPVLLAMFFALLANPIIRGLRRLYVPRFIAALLVLLVGISATYYLGRELVQPGADWIREVPRQMRDLAPEESAYWLIEWGAMKLLYRRQVAKRSQSPGR